RSVCQNFEKDIIATLSGHIDRIKKYKKIYFIQQDRRQQFRELENGFSTFCSAYNLKSATIPGLEEHRIEKHGLYLTVEDKDLFNIIKSCKQKQYVLGQNIGVISYNDTPFKEIIGDGVSTISTDFQQMGQSAIEMIFNNRTLHIENPSKLILRNSF
ncbi:MAG: LacI family DNA-binding transcriptional regulator, partial [Cyclobacteriaceae bacterium]|nr:LacI family DNA-binding transcriptional regulator [Cyclobacteriaceae bacterium]